MAIVLLGVGALILIVVLAAISERPDPPTWLPGPVVVVSTPPANGETGNGTDALLLLFLLMLAALVVANLG